ncbi:GNAT family N-acetyltransferase [Chryseobacterium sp.]|uniref:GNAT family N-acetyltransferase n=1 Tax=Chryseobacterium sp. TaxID=1871047 RepID=UPI0025BA3D43|nr:GNAT family N-acetyltransferase [Chryseobacterium sp.]MBV8328584.1 GNAT family N-acetyltransferase [Chryseobacterium sp.]
MIIREGNINDLSAMKQLFADTITYVCQKDYNNEQIEAWKSGTENETRWHKVMQNQMVLVAESGHKLIGFCTLDHGSYIDLLFIHHQYQQQGVALKLYTQIEKEALRQDTTELTADVSITAKPFFEKMGFKTICQQTVNIKGADLINYKMSKKID